MASCKPYQNYDLDTKLLTTTLISKAQKRWRASYLAIRAIRALLSLLSDAVSSQKTHLHHDTNTILVIKTPIPIKPTSPACLDRDKLTQLVKNKDITSLTNLGGVRGIANALKTNPETGTDMNSIPNLRETFGSNTYPKRPPKSFLYFILEAFKDTTIIVLIICGCLSLGFGINEHGPREGWYDGGSIIVAVILVVLVSAISNFRQQAQFQKLSNISSDIKIDVLRNNRRQQVSIHDIVVGDVIFLKLGDQVPADGLFLDGFSLHVDESSMTGESEYVEVDPTKGNPFLFSGSKVVDGDARFMVTAVGINTVWGEMMSSIVLQGSKKELTPLQVRLERLTSAIGKVGLGVAFLVLVVMLVRYFTGNTKDENGMKQYKGKDTDAKDVMNGVIDIIAAAVTIVVVAIPEGLPLAVTLTLAYSMKRMMGDNAMVRKLSACETMGSATVICTDKTGTLTLNKMSVTKFWIGKEYVGEELYKGIGRDVVELLYQGVGLNTTGSVYKGELGIEFSGSPTEKAILSWAVEKFGMDVHELKRSFEVLHLETFNSMKKGSGVLVRKVGDGSLHVHWKGAAEIVLEMCSSYYGSNGEMKLLNENERCEMKKTIEGMAASSLRCIAFAHKKVFQEEAMEINCENDKKEKERQRVLPEDGFILLGIVGLKDPCRPEAKKAVEICKSAGVSIKMITGDNIFTAKAIATECGILELNQQVESGEVVEGAEFRNYTDEERMNKVDKIRVMARSSPFDKLLMVQCLKNKGHVVAVTGDGTNDAPALKEADIGLSMGIQGTEVAKESSDIVILDDNFMSVATVLRWGRCVYNNIQKFIQFQLTVNVAALVINFVAAVSAGEVPLTTVQLLWVNLIMDSLGALALATERPSDELLDRPPVGRFEPLVTRVMWRNLLFQALYQIAILLIFQFRGRSIFNVTKEVNKTIIFNTFVFCQVFNEFNARKLEKQNVFEGIHKNHLFLGIVGFTIILQVIMVEFLKKFAKTRRLNLEQWAFCILIAAMSWPIGWFVKLLPVSSKPYKRCLRKIVLVIKKFG